MERFSSRRRRQFLGAVLAAAVLAPALVGLIAAQGGDQFLDGIGETALVARYLFNGNAEDSSRNHFHAALRGSGAAYVEDARFGRALELAGNGSHAQLPANALAGEDTISVTGWLYLPTGASGPVFDFGQSASSRLFATVSAASGFSAGFAAGGARGGDGAQSGSGEPVGPPGGGARSCEPSPDDLSRRRPRRPGGQRRRQRRAVDRSGLGRREPPLHRPLARRRRSDAPREAARRPRLPRGVDRRPGGGDLQRRVGPPGWPRPRRGSRAGHLDRRHPQGIPAGVAARLGPRHPGRNNRGPAPAAAARDPGGVPRQGHGPERSA